MPRFLSFVVVVMGSAGMLGAGCSPKPMADAGSETTSATPAPMGDRAVVAGGPVSMAPPDLIADGEVEVRGGATLDTVALGPWMIMAATTPDEHRQAEQAALSGAYLGDPVRVTRQHPRSATR